MVCWCPHNSAKNQPPDKELDLQLLSFGTGLWKPCSCTLQSWFVLSVMLASWLRNIVFPRLGRLGWDVKDAIQKKKTQLADTDYWAGYLLRDGPHLADFSHTDMCFACKWNEPSSYNFCVRISVSRLLLHLVLKHQFYMIIF